MKTRFNHSLKLITAFFFFSIGCQRTVESNQADDMPVDTAFVLETNPSIINLQDLNQIQLDLTEIYSVHDSLGKDVGKKVKLVDAVAALFDPANHPCPLPEKVARKLKKLKEESKAWAPKFVTDQVASMPDSVLLMAGTSLSTLLHSVTIKRPNGTSFDWVVIGSPTYASLSVEDFVLSAGYNSFIYTLDCSGYMNAAIEGSGVVPGVDIKSQAGTALDKQNSMFIGGGVLISPLHAAVFAEALGISMDTLGRVKVLKSIMSIPGIGEDDTIDTPLSFEVLWASKQGSSSFNGRANFAASGGGGFGVAQISASGRTGGDVSRKSSFSSFDTYVTNRIKIPSPEKITFKKVRALIKILQEKPGNL